MSDNILAGIARFDGPPRAVAPVVSLSIGPGGSEFPAILAHELRNPLASIHHAVRLLGNQTIEIATRQKIQALLERQVSHMTRLVNDLVDASRISTGRLHLKRERIDLRTVLAHAAGTLESQIEERSHRLVMALPDEPVWSWADPCRLEQVFVNLLANACKYTDAGGEINVRAQLRDRQAIISVRDNGIGIAPRALPHIFDLFRQADAVDMRSRSGLGIGLAVVRHLVELHGGRVTAASAGARHGSEFTVRLPIEH